MKRNIKIFLGVLLVLLLMFTIIVPSSAYTGIHMRMPLSSSPYPPGGGSGGDHNNPPSGDKTTPENPIMTSDGSQSTMVKNLTMQLSQMPKGKLSEEEKNLMESMMSFEKMVRDMYAVMYEKWKTQAFENLGKNASASMAAVKLLLDRYNLENPVKDMTKLGNFEDKTLQELFDTMVEKGKKSPKDALEACAEIEELNIVKIKNALETSNSDDLKLVYKTILDESIKTLKSLVYMLSIQGISYKPKYLTLSEFNEIMGIKQNSESNKNNNEEPDKNTSSDNEKKIVMSMKIGDKVIEINGKKIEFDVAPIIKNNRTLVPIRVIVESMGGKIYWDPTERKVTITLGNKTIELWIGKAQAVVNGKTVWIDPENHNVVPIIIPPGRTMLPLRFILEELGATVVWDPVTKTITITYIP